MQAEIFRLWQEKRSTALPVTHDVAEALVAERVIVLSDRTATIRADVPVEPPCPCREAMRLRRGTSRIPGRSS